MLSRFPDYWYDYPEISERSAVTFFHLVSTDGVPLNWCRIAARSRECVVLLMPPMTPLLLVIPTLVTLSRYLPVLAWEPREFATPPALGSGSHSFDSYVRDAEEVVASGGVEIAHLITWCAGAEVAAELVYRQKVQIRSAVLIAPVLVFELCNFDRPHPFSIHQMIHAVGMAGDPEAEVKFRRLQNLLRLSSAVTPIESALQRLTRINLSTLERVRRRVAVDRAFFNEWNFEQRNTRFLELSRKVPTHAICFRDDDTAGCPPEAFVAAHPELTFNIQEKGGHFALFKFPDQVATAVLDFYRSQRVVKG